ncbi:hypothetical protein [Kitasatospora sp. SUK 42]|uniref:hypothetical protein n=1 Tax=Kitasatospora sp. SUK 42 TaxID=1588882 RepID=UPI0018C94464|nr:hypothetical protein [Kitasatospora sp. SUK 42]MBV2153820.1 hypothetical protein [Kitasatospora sp. SUK 42]
MKPQVNIAVVVDVIGALSDKSLQNGNLCLIDDGSFDSRGQGTPELVTVVVPGQVVQWSALAVDLQTPVEIRSISFLPAGGGPAAPEYGVDHGPAGAPALGDGTDGGLGGAAEGAAGGLAGAAPAGHQLESGQLDLNVWSGVVPPYLTPGVPYRYRLELQMYEGDHSVLHVDSPALMCL